MNVSNKIYITAYHLNELLSNLIDTAIENCSTNDPKINIIINEDVFLYIEVINSIDVSVLNTNPNLITNKKGDIHGHGVKSIKRIVNEYNGNIKFFENGLKSVSYTHLSACIKTIIYFGIMYISVILLNTFKINKCKLIDLLYADKKSVKTKIKNPIICVLAVSYTHLDVYKRQG